MTADREGLRERVARALYDNPAFGCGHCAYLPDDADFDAEPDARSNVLADAVLAVIAENLDGIAGALREHVHDFDPDDWRLDYGCSCGCKYSRTSLGLDDEPCHDEHAHHQAEAVAAYLRGDRL